MWLEEQRVESGEWDVGWFAVVAKGRRVVGQVMSVCQ
jgi:hypothetical protein